MRIDRSLRTIALPNYPMGYRASTQEQITEPGLLELASRQMALNPLDFSPFPETLILQVRLDASPVNNPAMVRVHVDGTTYPSVIIYEPSVFGHQFARLIYAGFGSAQWPNKPHPIAFQGVNIETLRLNVPQSLILFEREFLFFQEEALEVHRQNLGRQRFRLTPPGQENIFPLWPYGGYFRHGCWLREIQQTVFTPSLAGQRVEIKASRLSEWDNQPLMFGNKQVVFLADFQAQHRRSLAGDVETGEVRVHLQYGHDAYGQPDKQAYRSCRYIQEDPVTGYLNIIFIKEA